MHAHVIIVEQCVTFCNDFETDVCWNHTLSLRKEEYTGLTDMQEKLEYHFMGPFDKWKKKKQISGKLLLHVLSIILITTQVN